jgi:hypothetical protein
MSDGVALSILSLLAIGIVALAMVWPQGQGAPSPPPFGHPLRPVESPIAKALAPLALRGPEAVARLAEQKALRRRHKHP